MIKITPHKIAILMGILLSPSVFATDINVEFTATVKATTCNITLTGNNVTNDGNNNYTLRIPKMGLDKIANKTTESQADFKLVASGCSSGISWIDTTLTGNASSSSPKLIIPQSGDSSSTTSNIGMGFKKRTTFKNLRYGLSSSVVLAASLFSVPSYAATDSIGLTVITTVEIGTCTATLVNDSDQDISVVDFGDVYISEINAKTKVKTFKLKFKDCAGIPNKKAQIKLTKRATCEGTANDGAGFANGSTAADKASAVAVEVWSTETPATGSATQFSCVTPASQEVTISNAANAVVYYPMSARLVVEKNKTVSNVTAGKFSAPATFTVTYN